MTDHERDEVIAKLLDARASSVSGGVTSLDEEQRAEIEPLLEVAELLWEVGHGAPPLEADPVAAMLGLVPDPRYALDPDALKRARRSANLKLVDLVDRLTARGWDVRRGDVFRWENQSAADVSPALIKAIAEEMRIEPDRLIVRRQEAGEHEMLAELSQSSRFASLVKRWAGIQGTSPGLAASTLKSRALATVHRGDRPDAEQLLASLEALVAALEDGGHPREPQ
ncbi:hypothetical protein P3102_34235 [Amycolatopsis sp. QT-25]|uniref:hypothetical protein n=1 Tax=Amycolatopsis sp. QT-25 TaxID=3034022 RepID=UPI0023ECD0BC|nr:hypothetical protein [Amycolatopsis sp. QT-25]WET79036.1 hypothetical protein P3102_34235 [Amycolatopsis sp. QT-25]